MTIAPRYEKDKSLNKMPFRHFRTWAAVFLGGVIFRWGKGQHKIPAVSSSQINEKKASSERKARGSGFFGLFGLPKKCTRINL